MTVTVQGNHLLVIEDILENRYKVPKKYLELIDNIGAKKKK
jgi:hypothetical protein